MRLLGPFKTTPYRFPPGPQLQAFDIVVGMARRVKRIVWFESFMVEESSNWIWHEKREARIYDERWTSLFGFWE
jgi:hypothetical protein